MKTIIEFKDGSRREHSDIVPSFRVEDRQMDCLDDESTVIDEDLPLDEIQRVIFEP